VTDENGEGRRVVVQNVDQSEIAVSRDGKWLVYAADGRLWRIPMAGGPPRRLIDVAARGPAFSPAGDRVAFYYGPRNERRLAVMPIEGDRVAWSVPATYYLPDIRWAPAGDALFVNGHGTEFSNIWKQPFKGEATRVTNLREQFAMRFDVSPDGKSLALVRGQVMRDAVLITGFE
jgi:dipeptidyl aminopeptidase/acylaminoacyl peptidase